MTVESLELGKEYPPEGEELAIEQIFTISKASMASKPHPPTLRDQHPKSHGYVEGEMHVEENIPEDLKVGVFREAKTYPISIRFSNGSSDRDADGNFLPDTDGNVRGMAIKLKGVVGETVTNNSLHQGEQDFILMNSPTFFIKDVEGYIKFFAMMRAIRMGEITFKSDRTPEKLPINLQEPLQAVSYAIPLVEKVKARQTSSPLEITYWSATPYKLGDRAIKFCTVPHPSPQSFDLEKAEDKSNYLREAMKQHLDNRDAYFDFKIQLQTDAVKMPVEDPTVEWDEQISPYIKVATIKIPMQDFNSAERKQLDEQQSFSPWHSLAEHRPLGGVNRARKMYGKMAEIRNRENQCETEG